MSDSESSGSSDAEELARCREAAMPAWGLEQPPRVVEKPRAGRELSFGRLPERTGDSEHGWGGWGY